MRARDQSSIFSTGGKFRPDYGLLLELHALTLVACSYALLVHTHSTTWPHILPSLIISHRHTLSMYSTPSPPHTPSPHTLTEQWRQHLSREGVVEVVVKAMKWCPSSEWVQFTAIQALQNLCNTGLCVRVWVGSA